MLKSGNENAWFSSSVVQSSFFRTISASNEKKEMNGSMKEFVTVSSVKLTKALLERCAIAQSSKHLKAHGNNGLQLPIPTPLIFMYAIDPKIAKTQLWQGAGKDYGGFGLSLVLKALRAFQEDNFREHESEPSLEKEPIVTVHFILHKM